MDNGQSTPGDRNVQTGWDAEFARQPGKTLLGIYRDTYGDDSSEEVEPYSFVTKKDLARILRSGARFVFTVLEGANAEFYRSPLQDYGFHVEAYEETPDYRRRRLGLYERILDCQGPLLEEMGEGFRAAIDEAKRGVTDGLADSRRSLVVARRI